MKKKKKNQSYRNRDVHRGFGVVGPFRRGGGKWCASLSRSFRRGKGRLDVFCSRRLFSWLSLPDNGIKASFASNRLHKDICGCRTMRLYQCTARTRAEHQQQARARARSSGPKEIIPKICFFVPRRQLVSSPSFGRLPREGRQCLRTPSSLYSSGTSVQEQLRHEQQLPVR